MIKANVQQNSPLILIVDDDRTLRMVMRIAMENEGYRVVERSNGKEGLATCQELKPDIVLIDGMMPQMNGFTCCRELINILGDECPPILMITVLDDQESVDRAFAAGATDYLTKPIHMPVLLQRVKRMLATQKAIAELKQQIQDLQQFVTIDPLTNLSNRKGFEIHCHREWLRGVATQTPLSLILCIVDEFEGYRNAQGAATVDECLKQITQILVELEKNPANFVARYDEEKFAVLLPNTPAKKAVTIAQNISTQFKSLNLVTVSIGFATLIPNSQSSSTTLIEKALTTLTNNS